MGIPFKGISLGLSAKSIEILMDSFKGVSNVQNAADFKPELIAHWLGRDVAGVVIHGSAAVFPRSMLEQAGSTIGHAQFVRNMQARFFETGCRNVAAGFVEHGDTTKSRVEELQTMFGGRPYETEASRFGWSFNRNLWFGSGPVGPHHESGITANQGLRRMRGCIFGNGTLERQPNPGTCRYGERICYAESTTRSGQG